MKKIFKMIVVLAFMAALPGAVYAACTQTLYAGKNIDVGTVTFSDDGTVTYTLKSGWVMTESHLHVATKLSGIPQTKTGNPIPGQFKYKRYYDPGVMTDSYSTGTWPCGKPVYIAAHAVVAGYSSLSSMSIVSDTTTVVMQGNDPGATYPKPAVASWEPFEDPADPSSSYWDEQTGNFFTGTGADWIWESYRSLHPVDGDIVEFEKPFSIPGEPVSGILYITTDNGYEAVMNSQLIGSAQLAGDWKNSLLREPRYDSYGNILVAGVSRQGWQSIEQYDITKKLLSGANILHITGVNEEMSNRIIDGFQDSSFNGTVDDNPGGLIYKLDIQYITGSPDREETAWAAGNPFSGKNWATYFTCSIPCP